MRYSSLQMIPQSGMVSIILSPLLIILHSSIKEILPYDVQHFDVEKLVLGKCSIIMGKEIYQANQVKENGRLTCKMTNMKEISR
jgi:hypothetical protein